MAVQKTRRIIVLEITNKLKINKMKKTINIPVEIELNRYQLTQYPNQCIILINDEKIYDTRDEMYKDVSPDYMFIDQECIDHMCESSTEDIYNIHFDQIVTDMNEGESFVKIEVYLFNDKCNELVKFIGL